MAKTLNFFEIDTNILDSEVPAATGFERDDIHFYRFIGGNPGETDDMLHRLNVLQDQKKILIGMFRFPFRFEGKKRIETAAAQYFHMRERCDAIIFFDSDQLMKTVNPSITVREAHLAFNDIEEHAIRTMYELVDHTGEMNIDFQDIDTFIKQKKGPLFLHTVEGDVFNEPLKYLIDTPYLPDDFTDGKQLMINIGYARDVDMEAFRQINLRLSDLFSKADLFKMGAYYMDEPGQHFEITLIVNGIADPLEAPEDFPKLSPYKRLLQKWRNWTVK